MSEMRRFGLPDLLLLGLVLAVAGGMRAGYLAAAADGGRTPGPLAVQARPGPLPGLPPGARLREHEDPTELDALVHNVREYRWFGSLAPFAPAEEQTAHVAPGYPWLVGQLARLADPAQLDRAVRWLQCGLGTLTAGLYFLFARRAFRGLGVATLAGLFGALHPFWIIDTAALADGVLAAFLLGLALVLGARAGQTAGPVTSFLYGLALAGLALVRAALLPFAFVALAWLLLRSRRLPRGWLCAVLAFLGFVNGLAPWVVRNTQVFGEPIPIADSTWYHLWIGNNPHATGGPETEAMRQSAPAGELEKVAHQPARYARLGRLVWQEVRDRPAETCRRRIQAGLDFALGERWFADGQLAEQTGEPLPDWLAHSYRPVLQATLLALLALALLGWRWSAAWRWESLPAALAAIWVPLPYVLGHAGALSGPRLPLDGVLLCFAAFALVGLLPGAGTALRAGPQRGEDYSPGKEFIPPSR